MSLDALPLPLRGRTMLPRVHRLVAARARDANLVVLCRRREVAGFLDHLP